ncbi:MAG: PAS domain-containing protein [Candidatus Binatia bacterium]
MMFFITDLDNKVLENNQDIDHTLGYTREELLGKPLTVLLTLASSTIVRTQVTAALQTRTALFSCDLEALKKDGSQVCCKAKGKILYTGDQAVALIWVM